MLLGYEVTRETPMHKVEIKTPLASMHAKLIDGNKIVFASILRAGIGILDGMLETVPGARVGHIGLYQDPQTLAAVEYHFKMPHNMRQRDAIVVNAMLTTDNSAMAAVDRLRATGPRWVRMVCLLTCPEGLRNFHQHHLDVPVITVANDQRLNNHGYTLPGLADAGDRIL